MILDHVEKSSSRVRAGKKIFAKNVRKLTKTVKKSGDERGRIKIRPRADAAPVLIRIPVAVGNMGSGRTMHTQAISVRT